MKIGIIGAGLSGLSAAKILQNKGHQVEVFDKARGRGGRLANKRLEWGTLDIGAQYFTAKSSVFKKEVRQWLAGGVVSQWSFSPFAVKGGRLFSSPDGTIRYVGLPLMNGIAHYLASDLTLKFQVHVEKLSYDRGKWTLIMADGNAAAGFDWIVVSCPAEQSKPLLSDWTELAKKIPDAIHLPCWTLGLATSGDVDLAIQGIFGDELISWVSRQSAKPGYSSVQNTLDHWVLHFSPSWSTGNGKNTLKDILGTGVDWLQKTLEAQLEIHHHYRHFWRYANLSNKHFNAPYLVDLPRKISVIGAWCSGGRVEGAYISAQKMVAECFR